MKQIKKAEKLMQDIETKVSKWNERSSFTMKGIKNLSMSDLDSLMLYAQRLRVNKSMGLPNFQGLIEPLGDVRKVLEKYDLI